MGIALGFGFFMSSVALAVPGQFVHQGRLTDEDGAPLEGDLDVTFRLTDMAEGGSAVWYESITLSLNEGYYAALLGADEEENPLDVEILELSPLWLELQISGSPPLYPRLPIHSVPFATIAEVATEVAGGPVAATEVTVGGVLVINDAGEWVGPDVISADEFLSYVDGATLSLGSGTTIGSHSVRFADELVPWTEIEGIPESLLDGDADSLATLVCVDGQVLRFSGPTGYWECSEDQDTHLSVEEVRGHVSGAVIDLGTGSTVGGAAISTGAHTTSVTWDDVTGIPEDFADGIDDGISWGEVETSLGESAVDLHPDTTIGGEPFASVAGGGTQTTGTVVLGNLEVTTLAPESDSPQFTHTAWLDGSLGWEPLPYRSELANLGDGSDGAFVPTDASMSMEGGVYNYTEFELPEGYTISVTGSSPLVIRSQTTLEVAGTITANGGNGSSYRGGTARGGGDDGDDGLCGGYSASLRGSGGSVMSECCDAACTDTSSSGGRGGRKRKMSGCTSDYKGGGGGASGGRVYLLSRYTEVSGTIEVAGGDGGNNGSNPSGGGGAGGVVYIEAAGLTIASSAYFRVSGGEPGDHGTSTVDGVGADGRLAIKARSDTYPVSVTYMEYFTECTVDANVSVEVDLHYDTAGLNIRNFGLDDKTVLMTMVE